MDGSMPRILPYWMVNGTTKALLIHRIKPENGKYKEMEEDAKCDNE